MKVSQAGSWGASRVKGGARVMFSAPTSCEIKQIQITEGRVRVPPPLMSVVTTQTVLTD